MSKKYLFLPIAFFLILLIISLAFSNRKGQPTAIERITTTRTERIVNYFNQELKTDCKKSIDYFSCQLDTQTTLKIFDFNDPKKYLITFDNTIESSQKTAGNCLGYVLKQIDTTDQQNLEIITNLAIDTTFNQSKTYTFGNWQIQHTLENNLNTYTITYV